MLKNETIIFNIEKSDISLLTLVFFLVFMLFVTNELW